MQVFATRRFGRIATKLRLAPASLRRAVQMVEHGGGARLGAGLFKQRVEMEGRGKSGGARVILYWRCGEYALLLHAYAKNRQENLTPAELEHYKEATLLLARVGPREIERLLASGEWRRIE